MLVCVHISISSTSHGHTGHKRAHRCSLCPYFSFFDTARTYRTRSSTSVLGRVLYVPILVPSTVHVTVTNALALKSYACAMLPHRFVNPMPRRSSIPSPINTTHPLDAAEHISDVSTPLACESVSLEVEDTHPPSCTRHAPPHHSTASVARTSTVSSPIGPIFRSVDASPRVSLVKPHGHESDHGNTVDELSIIASHHDRSTPHIASISPPILPPRHKTDRRSHRY